MWGSQSVSLILKSRWFLHQRQTLPGSAMSTYFVGIQITYLGILLSLSSQFWPTSLQQPHLSNPIKVGVNCAFPLLLPPYLAATGKELRSSQRQNWNVVSNTMLVQTKSRHQQTHEEFNLVFTNHEKEDEIYPLRKKYTLTEIGKAQNKDQ
jgi:hypothetical protein